jgi:hypothetical protein
MSPSQCIGLLLNQATAVTSIVSTRIYNGNRPDTTTVPCINYYEIAGGKKENGFYRQSYSINCRAVTAETALSLVRTVEDLFNGSSGTGIYGYASSGSVFGITRSFTKQMQGLIPEPDDGLYNAPIDIMIIFPATSIA